MDNLATRFDLTREEVVENYRQRIQSSDRTRLTREERDTLALVLVDRLIELNQRGEDSSERIQSLCKAEKALLEEGYPQGSINSVYLPNYTRILREAISEGKLTLNDLNSYPKPWTKRDGSESGVTQTHFALDFLTYDGAIQTKLRVGTTTNNNKRQDDLKPVRLQAYLEQVQTLLTSEEPEILTVVLAAVTGRRHAEIVSLGQFESTNHPYLLRFEGQQKKAEAEAYEIPSLIPVQELLPVINRYRNLPGVKPLVGLDDSHPEIEAFNSRVNRRVQAIFGRSELVPVLEGFTTVSIHRLRALYGAIAIHYFCANNQNVHRFLQNHLGHVLDTEVGAANSRATDHYFHYYLVREDDTPITARGIKLMAHGSLPETDEPEIGVEATEVLEVQQPVLEVMSEVEPEPEAQESKSTTAKRCSIRIYAQDLPRWLDLLSEICPECQTQQERMGALLKWVEKQRDQPATQQPVVEQVEQVETPVIEQEQSQSVQPVIDLSRTLAFLTGEIEVLRQRLEQLQTERNQAVERLDSFAQLEEELAGLRAENGRLKQAQQTLTTAYSQLLANGTSDGHSKQAEQPSKTAEPRIVPQFTEISAPAVATEMATTVTANRERTAARPGGAQERAKAIMQLVQEWNDAYPDQTFAITSGLLEREFGVNRKAVGEFLSAFQAEIQDYHQTIGVENERSHNRQTGRDVEKLKEFVKFRL